MISSDEREHMLHLVVVAESNAKKMIKPGDRLRVGKCPGRKRSITYRDWNGPWIVSNTGINDFSPLSLDRLNDRQVDFTGCVQLSEHPIVGG